MRSGSRGLLRLEWRRTGGADFYRIERTRDGREYECLGETRDTGFFHRVTVCRDPWFYRVTAVNCRGGGTARMVWFFERRGNGRNCLRAVPVRPGLRVNIYEAMPEQ